MWTPAKTTAITTAFTSPRHETPELSGDMPPILAKPQYKYLYRSIYESEKIGYKSIEEEQGTKKKGLIRSSVTEKLRMKESKKSFIEKFSLSGEKQKRKKRNYDSIVGKTKLQQNEEQLSQFLMDSAKAINLQEDAMLIEYYLKDEEKTKRKINYIQKIQNQPQHRRLSLSKKQHEKLLLTHEEEKYRDVRKKCYIKYDQFMDKALSYARQNPTYKREKNFALTQYIINRNIKNIMQYHEIGEKSVDEEEKHNRLRRIYLNYAQNSQSHRIYYDYISQDTFHFLQSDIQNLSSHEKVNSKSIRVVIDTVLKYKYKKVIHFQDFLQIFNLIQEQYKINLIQKYLQKKQQIFYHPCQAFIKENQKTIENYIKKSKVDTGIKLFFESQSQKIIGKKYLPLTAIVDMMKGAKVVPKKITMCKLYHTCLWEEKRNEGFNLEEFKKIQQKLGLSLSCTKEGLEEYMEILNLSQFASID